MAVTMWPKVLYLWALWAVLSTCTEGQSCPSDVGTCCECLSVPGCSWYWEPHQPAHRCAPTPSPSSDADIHHSSGSPRHIVPYRLHHLQVTAAKDKPIHQGRRRLIRPQQARLSLALSARYEMTFQVLALSTTQQIQVKYRQPSLGISLLPADPTSCSEGFTRLSQSSGPHHRARPGGRRGRGGGRRRGSNRRGRRLNLQYECLSSAPALIHRLRLVVDMYTCYSQPAVIKVDLGPGTKRLKLLVTSDCHCPDVAGNHTLSADRPGPELGMTDTNHSGGHSCSSSGGANPEVQWCQDENPRCQSDQVSASCSGRGQCLCGECLCDRANASAAAVRYYGQYCQCSDSDCPIYNGGVCGGPNRGVCTCGQCQCHEGYMGEACHIVTSIGLCVPPWDSSGQICSGHGQCEAGRCLCDRDSLFTGQYCENCPTCPSRCDMYKHCVQCLIYGSAQTGPCDGCLDSGDNVQYRAVNDLMESDTECLFIDEDGCVFDFSYDTNPETGATVINYKTRIECPPPESLSAPADP